jgi:hypothetical protein
VVGWLEIRDWRLEIGSLKFEIWVLGILGFGVLGFWDFESGG